MIYKCSNIPLGVVLLLCSFIKIIVVGFPLRPTTDLARIRLLTYLTVTDMDAISWRWLKAKQDVVGYSHNCFATTAPVHLADRFPL